MSIEYVELGTIDCAFTRGGNRLCFVDPRNADHCIKVLRPDRSPEIRRKQKGFPKSLRPLTTFDENREEYEVWVSIEKKIGEPAFELIPRCFGYVQTDFGRGLVMELVRDDDGKISKTVKQVLWEGGMTESIRRAITQFSESWVKLAMPSKKILLHNVLLKKRGDEFCVIVIDGLGWQSVIPVTKLSLFFARQHAKKKIRQFGLSIQELSDKKQHGQGFGYHGWLDDNQRA